MLANQPKNDTLYIKGFNIVVENRAFTYRQVAQNVGQKVCLMPAHYGYLQNNPKVGVFVGAFPENDTVYLINQKAQGGYFDKHIAMFGFLSEQQAVDTYQKCFEYGYIGLMSVVPCTIEQLKWWLANGDKSRPVTKERLPYAGLERLDSVIWGGQEGTDLASHGGQVSKLLYQIRQSDNFNHALEPLSYHDLTQELGNQGFVYENYDALVIEYNKLERKAKQLLMAMQGAADIVKPVGVAVSKPLTKGGVANVVAWFEMEDGQAVGVFFHNPDKTPKKIDPTDEMISYKWVLNKKDITIVVAPENGKDLVIRTVAKRIMQLVDANHDRFLKANSDKAELNLKEQNLNAQVIDKQAELDALNKAIEALEAQKAEREANKLKVPTGEELRQQGYNGVISELKKLGWTDDSVTGGLSKSFIGANEKGTINPNGILNVIVTAKDANMMATVGGDTIVSGSVVIIPQYGVTAQTEESYKKEANTINNAVDSYIDNRKALLVQPNPITLTGKELGDFDDTPDGKKALRAAAKAEFEKMLGQWVDCPALNSLEGENTKVEIRKRGVKEFFAFSGDTRKLKLASAIVQIIKTARLDKPQLEQNYKQDKKNRVVGYYHLQNKIMIDGNLITVRVVIEKDDKGLLHYDVIVPTQASEAENLITIQGQPPMEKSAEDSPDYYSGGSADENSKATFDSILDSGAWVVNLFIEGEPVEVIQESVEDNSESTQERPADYRTNLANTNTARVVLTDKDAAEMPYEQYAKMVFNGEIANDKPPAKLRFEDELARDKKTLEDFNAKKISRSKILGTKTATDKDVRDYLLKNIAEDEQAIATEGASDPVIRANWEYAVKNYARQLGLSTNGKAIDEVLKDIKRVSNIEVNEPVVQTGARYESPKELFLKKANKAYKDLEDNGLKGFAKRANDVVQDVASNIVSLEDAEKRLNGIIYESENPLMSGEWRDLGNRKVYFWEDMRYREIVDTRKTEGRSKNVSNPWRTGDGKLFESLPAAKKHELETTSKYRFINDGYMQKTKSSETQEPVATNPDRDYLQSIIEGSMIPKSSDMDAVIALTEKYETDEDMMPLLEQALEKINQTQQTAVKEVM